MAKLDWRPTTGSGLAAGHYSIYPENSEWVAYHEAEGEEIARGTHQACLDACEKSEAKAAGPDPIQIAADGRCSCSGATPCPLGRTGTTPRCTIDELAAAGVPTRAADDVEPATAAELIAKSGKRNMLAERRLSDEQMDDLVERTKRA